MLRAMKIIEDLKKGFVQEYNLISQLAKYQSKKKSVAYSEKKEEKSPQRRFYPFNKSTSQFESNEQELKLHSQYHTAVKITKKVKSNTSQNYSIPWIKISKSIASKEYQPRLNRLIVLTGELFRLLDRHLPKYRLYSDNKTEFVISKEVLNSKEFYDFFNNKIGPYQAIFKAAPVLEGMGRGFFAKYFYLDNDFHSSNALVDKNNYFFAIDHDWAWVPISWSFHRNHRYTFDSQSFLRRYNTEMTVKDYDNLPLYSDYLPGINEWCDDNYYYAYMKLVIKDKLFLNEKHFAALKILLTHKIQLQLIDYHIVNSTDKDAISTLLKSRHDNMIKILGKSSYFKKYISQNRIDIMYAVLFELYDFFKENRHYIPRDKLKESKDEYMKRIQPKVQQYAEKMIDLYSSLLSQWDEKSLSQQEIKDLKTFFNNIMQNDQAALKKVGQFYIGQGMKHFLCLASAECSMTTHACKNNSLFKPKIISSLTQEDQKQSMSTHRYS